MIQPHLHYNYKPKAQAQAQAQAPRTQIPIRSVRQPWLRGVSVRQPWLRGVSVRSQAKESTRRSNIVKKAIKDSDDVIFGRER